MSHPPLDARIVAGAREAGVDLDASRVQQLLQYLAHLERWNRTINLTALPLSGFPSATLDRLIFEPLRSGRAFGPGALRWVDFGSGGGSPAIPLKILLREASLTMVESRSRKAAFLRDVVRVVGLDDVQVLWDRVEAVERLVAGGSVDVVTMRAVRIDEAIAKSVHHLLSARGRVVLFGRVDCSPLFTEFEQVDVSSLSADIAVLQRRPH
jgi:16S rRNA (guanine527-N7)-methyltransferase